ncbi:MULTISPECIES: MFS transporter [Streptomyces]|uniref:MFS transporter n=1 Tax=Streptomyces TaxID=1883 RepID=UPI002931C42C|nr:MFS transporter [Streptomyces sp. NEAU-HV9]
MAVESEPATRPVTAPRAPGASRGLRAGYASGALVTGAFSTLPGLLLLPYLTDTLGVGAALAGTVILVPKVWNALLGPLVGHAGDRRPRRRVHLLGGGVGVAVAFALTFSAPGPASAGAWWAAVGFFLAATAYAFFQVPYSALPAEVTDRPADRLALVAGRVAVIAVSALLIGAAGPALAEAGGGGVPGHRLVGLFGAVCVLVGTAGVLIGIKGAPRGAARPAGPGLRRQLALARGVPAFPALLVGVVVQSVATGGLTAGAPYFSEHILGDRAATGLLVAAFVAPNLLTVRAWTRLGARVGHRAGYRWACAVFAVGCLLLFAAPALPLPLVLPVMALAGAGHAGQLLFLYAMLQDCIAGEGLRAAGVSAGLFTTCETLGLAVGPFLYGLILALFGYVSSGTGHAVTQSATAHEGILVGIALTPAAAALIAAAVLGRGVRGRA